MPSQRVISRLTNIRRLPTRQQGAIAVITTVLILVILGFCGFALCLSMVYNRKIELQTIADTIALAAAAELDGNQIPWPGIATVGNGCRSADDGLCWCGTAWVVSHGMVPTTNQST